MHHNIHIESTIFEGSSKAVKVSDYVWAGERAGWKSNWLKSLHIFICENTLTGQRKSDFILVTGDVTLSELCILCSSGCYLIHATNVKPCNY